MNISAQALEAVILQLAQENATLRMQVAQLQLDTKGDKTDD